VTTATTLLGDEDGVHTSAKNRGGGGDTSAVEDEASEESHYSQFYYHVKPTVQVWISLKFYSIFFLNYSINKI
jgi:hypothetical protein